MAAQQDKIDGRRGRLPVGRPDPDRIAAFRAQLAAAGMTVAEWARDHGEAERVDLLYKVLGGDRACATGETHRLAVKIGLKEAAPAPEPVRA